MCVPGPDRACVFGPSTAIRHTPAALALRARIDHPYSNRSTEGKSGASCYLASSGVEQWASDYTPTAKTFFAAHDTFRQRISCSQVERQILKQMVVLTTSNGQCSFDKFVNGQRS